MGFLASFYGSQAQSHQQTMQDWRRIWQADEELAQRERQMKLDEEYRQAELQFRKDEAKEAKRQFTINERLAEARLALDQNRFDAEYASNLISQIQPNFDSASRLGKSHIVDSIRAAVGGNEFIQGYVDAWEAIGINQQAISIGDAREYLTQAFQPVLLNADGTPYEIPEPIIEESLKVMEAESPSEGAVWREMYESRKEALAENRAWAVDAFVDRVNFANLHTQAEIQNLESTTKYNLSRTETEDQARRQAADLFASELRASEAGARLAELEVQDKTARLAVLEDFLASEYALLNAQVRQLELGNDFEAAVFDDLVTQVARETQLLESDVRVALATEDFRINAAEMDVKYSQALIDQVNRAIDVTYEARQDALLNMGLELAAQGNTEVLEALGEQFFGHIEGWEDVMEPILEMSRSEQSLRRNKTQAEIALLQNQASDIAETTRLREFEAQTRRQQVMSSLRSVNAGVQGNLPLMPADFLDAENTVRLTTGYSIASIQEGLAEAQRMDDGIRTLLEIRATGGGSGNRAFVESLEAMLAEYGITAPRGATGQWDDQAIDIALSHLDRARASKEEEVANQMDTFYSRYGPAIHFQQTPEEVFRLSLSPDTREAYGGGRELSTVQSRVLERLGSTGPEGNVVAAQQLVTTEEARHLLETVYGGDEEALEYLQGVIHITLANLAASSEADGFLGFDNAAQIYNSFLQDPLYGETQEHRQAFLNLVGYNSPRDIEAYVNELRSELSMESATVYAMQNIPIFHGASFDITTSSGIDQVFNHTASAFERLNRVSELGRQLSAEASRGGLDVDLQPRLDLANEISNLLGIGVNELVGMGVLEQRERGGQWTTASSRGTYYDVGPNFATYTNNVRRDVNQLMSSMNIINNKYGRGTAPGF